MPVWLDLYTGIWWQAGLVEGSTDWKGSELQKVCDYLVSATRGKSGKLGKVVAETVYFAVVNVTLYFVNSKEWQLKTRCRTNSLEGWNSSTEPWRSCCWPFLKWEALQCTASVLVVIKACRGAEVCRVCSGVYSLVEIRHLHSVQSQYSIPFRFLVVELPLLLGVNGM